MRKTISQSFQDKINDARKLHDIHTVLGTNKKHMVCPLPMHQHSNNTPSFSIYWLKGQQWWMCHGFCNLSGDVIDLVGYLKIPGYDPSQKGMVSQAMTLLDEKYD